jgi:hypothetical protein
MINYQIDSKNNNSDLEFKISDRKRMLHNGYEIFFNIKNNSTDTVYKDFKVKISSIGNSGSFIKSEEITLYESLKPNEKKYFSFKTKELEKKYKIRIDYIKPTEIS